MANSTSNSSPSAPVWPCCKESAEVVDPYQGTGKQAVIQSAVGFAVALLMYFWFKKPVMAGIVTGVTLVILACGLFIPPAFKAIERFFLKFGEWVGTGMTWLLLVPFFYLCFVPARMIQELTGKDPLNLKFKANVSTYWIPRKPVTDLSQYEKQH